MNKITENENRVTGSNNQALEQQLSKYYSSYEAEPFFKSNLRKRLTSQSAITMKREIGREKRRLPVAVFSQPTFKLVVGILFFALLLISFFEIHPVRAAIERALDFGYIEGAGFVKVSETNILNGATYSSQISQTIGIDQAVLNMKRVRIWFHSSGKKFSPESTNSEYLSYIEVNGEKYPLSSWSWDDGAQKGELEFSVTVPPMPMSFILYIAPDWAIPIQLIPMSQRPTFQTVTTFPAICQNHAEINLCLQAFVADSAGYHLWLSASSSDPDLYLQSLETSNPLTGKESVLMDSSGNALKEIYPSSVPMPVEVGGGNSKPSSKVNTTLSFSLAPQENKSLTLLVSGFTVKTPVNEIISCNPGNDVKVGSIFTCEKSINIDRNTLVFHSGKISQSLNGVRLTLVSDPMQPANGLLLTGVGLENLNGDSSSLLGSSFNVKTNQLELWMEVETTSIDQSFDIRVTDGELTIEEPFQFTWEINP